MKGLNEILSAVEILDFYGDPQTQLTGLSYDSRSVEPGNLFFATDGTHSDGHRFIPSAIEKGAVAVVYSDPGIERVDGVAYLRVRSPRKAMAPLSAAFYGFPGQKMKLIGVTGTDGKSTTVSLIHQLLQLSQIKSGFISTVAYQAGTEIKPNPYRQSTPEAPELQRLLWEMKEAGTEVAILETTSHSLSPLNNRLGTLSFDVAVFTNLSHEHLEFHGTMEQYRDDKGNLFRKLKPQGRGILNYDDLNSSFFASLLRESQVQYYSLKSQESHLRAFGVKIVKGETQFCLQKKGSGALEVSTTLPGLFNISNIMAALLAVSEITGKALEELYPLVSSLEAVEGRMNRVSHERVPFQVIVDYAHTPGAFESVLPALKTTASKGRLIVVFGSAGERDREKRPLQGEIASRFADIIILTDEDPRLEDSLSILKEIAQGIQSHKENETLFLIPNRRSAIGKAIDLAQEGDVVALLGKGHESCIITAEGRVSWNEKIVAQELLKERGF